METAKETSGIGRRFFGNTVLNYAGQGYSLILTFATAPYIVHHLGPDLFGVVALVQVASTFSGIASLGIGRALTKYVSELFWKKDFEQINRLFQTAWATCLVAGAIALAALIGPRHVIGRLFFRGGPEVSSVVGFAIYIAAFGLLTSMLLESVSGLPVALQRFDVINGVNASVSTVRNLGPVIVLAFGYGIRVVLAVILGANILAVVAFAVVSCRLIPGLSMVPRFNGPSFKKLFSFSLPLLLSALFALIVSRVDRFILAYYLPLAAVTFYALPYSISEKASLGIANITSVVFPFTSELHSKGAHDKVHELYLRGTKILMLVTLPITAILLAVPGPILRYWLGKEYAQEGAVALTLLAVATLLIAISAVPTVTSLGVGNAWMPATFAFGATVINLGANLLLVPRYGINGAATASLLSQLLFVPPFAYAVTRMIRFPLWELFSHGLLRPLLCAAAQFALLCILRRYVDSLISLALLCIASVCLFGILAFFGAISREERGALLRLPSLKFAARLGSGAES